MKQIKKLQLQIPVFLLAFTIILTGCDRSLICIKGEGGEVTVTQNLPEITGVTLESSGTVYLTQGEIQEVTVTGQQNIIDNIEWDVRGNVLHIDMDKCVKNHDDLIFYITIPDLSSASIWGSGSIIGLTSFTNIDEVDFRISGSGDIDMDVQANVVDTKVSGSGDITLSGTTSFHEFNLSGSGEYHSFDMTSQDCEINISGSGNCEVYCDNTLDVDISGSGSVYYKGYPAISTSITGSGEVIDAN